MNDIRRIFSPEDPLRTIIEENPQLLDVMNRFGLAFGFGDLTVRRACEKDDVHTDSFLAVCNFVCDRPCESYTIDLPSLITYLRKAHTHFLDFLLPSIRRKLIEAVNNADIDDVAIILLRFFDDYVREVRNHMEHENDEVFDYASRLLDGDISENFRITEYSLSHGSMTEKLNELKDVFIRHFHVKDNEILTSALYDIIYCGKELERHCRIENLLFIPEVEKLERSLQLRGLAKEESEVRPQMDKGPQDPTSDREKDIIRCVAKGMSNKEIANALCLSVHTVTTHRRNISAKLNIHSPAGLTIFAILHNIIDVNEVTPNLT